MADAPPSQPTPVAAAAQTVTITGRNAQLSAGVAGFGDIPLTQSPFSASVLRRDQLQDAGIAGLGDLTRLDAALTDAYNATGYWGLLAARGFALDPRTNVRRDGLPVSAETALPLANKAAVELLKGTSGLQAGLSSPAGLLNLVVKRPLAQPRTQGALEWTEPGTWVAEADLSRRSDGPGEFAWRLSGQASQLDPATRNSRGQASVLAAAAQWRLPLGLLEVEAEHSRQRQPSTPGFSLLGDRLPAADGIDPRLNLNNQAWSLPVIFGGQTWSLRWSHTDAAGTLWTAHLQQQQLRTEDRIAFPYGCSAEDRYDRYCSDGSFDFYDFRSEAERRTSRSADLSAQGQLRWAGLTQRWSTGLLVNRQSARFQRQAYNFVGTGRVDGSAQVPADPALTDENTQRDERSLEWRAQAVLALSPQWQAWTGLRHTRLNRQSVRTDGSRPFDVDQAFTTPWLALAWQPAPGWLAYASAGQGVESEVAPNRPRYTNAGRALPALKSQQWEAGLKHRSRDWQWQLTAFQIERPAWSDLQRSTGRPSDACSNADPCTRQADGQARHRGLEAEVEWNPGRLSLRGSALALQARREGSAEPAWNGLQPTNVPRRSVKLQGAYNVAALPGLALLALATHEGPRQVTPDNRLATTGWTRWDLGLRWALPGAGPASAAAAAPQASPRWVVRLGVDNVANARAWKESPFQFGHIYLYPLAPRTWRASVSTSF